MNNELFDDTSEQIQRRANHSDLPDAIIAAQPIRYGSRAPLQNDYAE